MTVQSSSAIIVMLVGLVQSQLMTYVQAMGVILGAEIGTTVTAQLIAFKLHDYALLIFASGFMIHMLFNTQLHHSVTACTVKQSASLGLVFF